MGLTMLLSVSLHVMLILGIGIKAPALLKKPEASSLEITLVQPKKTEPPPQQADYLAQVNQAGGGNQQTKALPTTPQPTEQKERADPAPQVVASAPAIEPAPATPPPEQVMAEAARETTTPTENPEPPPLTPSAAELMRVSREIARLDAAKDQFFANYAKIPRRKIVTAATKEYSYAQYLDAWRQKVERFGNLNYPQSARRKKLYGQLRLLVELTPDGRVNRIELRNSSGHSVLDQAASRIVELAGPYAPFPDNIRKETDLLIIIRTWQFMPGDHLRSR